MPSLLQIIRKKHIIEERCLTFSLKRCPITADCSVMSDNWLEDATVVMGTMSVLWGKDDVAALITDEVFVIRRNQEELASPESTCAAVVCQIELSAFPSLHMNGVSQ